MMRIQLLHLERKSCSGHRATSRIRILRDHTASQKFQSQKQLGRYDGGVILVTHDARLIQAVDCTLWVVALHDPIVKPNTAQIRRHPRGFEGYRQDVLSQLAEREEEIELIAMQRAREREEKRQKLGLAVREVDVSAGMQAKKKVSGSAA